MTAMVRVAALVGSSAAPELIQLSSPTPTDVPKRFQYLLGRVDKVELDKITLQLAAGGERVVSLPKGTLAPAKNTDVMAVLTDGGDKAIFLQPIDGIASSLATTMAADPP